MNLRRAAIAASVLALVLVGCTTSGSTPGDRGVATVSNDGASPAEAAPEKELSQEEAVEAYNKCVTKEGMPDLAIKEDLTGSEGGLGLVSSVNIESEDTEGSDNGAFNENTFDFEKFEEVEKKCYPYLESAFGDYEMSPEEEALMKDTELAFGKCLKDQGIDMPEFSAPGGGESLDPSDPDNPPDGGGNMLSFAEEDFEKFEEAFKACEHIFEEAEKQFNEESEGQ